MYEPPPRPGSGTCGALPKGKQNWLASHSKQQQQQERDVDGFSLTCKSAAATLALFALSRPNRTESFFYIIYTHTYSHTNIWLFVVSHNDVVAATAFDRVDNRSSFWQFSSWLRLFVPSHIKQELGLPAAATRWICASSQYVIL